MNKYGLILVMLLLTSCGLIKNRDDAYLNAKTGPVLQMPAGASEAQLGNDYSITGSQYPTSRKAVSIVPPKNTTM